MKLSDSTKRIITMIIFFIFAICIGGSYIQNLHFADLIEESGVNGYAEITNKYRTSDKWGVAYSIEYAFEFQNEGVLKQKNALASVSELFYNQVNAGETIPILYAPSNPNANCPQTECNLLKRDPIPRIGAVFFGAMGLLVMVADIYIRTKYKK